MNYQGEDRVAKKKDSTEDININIGFGDLFKGIGSLVNLVGNMCEEGKTELTRTGEIAGLDKDKGIRAIYGFTVKLGANGSPSLQSFGNISKQENTFTVQEVREPIVDIFEEEDGLLLIVELPGVTEAAINLEVKDDIVIISANAKDRKYAKEILLPFTVDPNAVKSAYRHGILEIRLLKIRN